MNENDPASEVPEATVLPQRRLRLSAVWIIPIVAALLGGWIAVQKYLAAGPTIAISFASAEGLEAGKTTVKYNGVNVGTIQSLKVADDRRRIVASVQMAAETRDWLVEDTLFWVVRPRIGGGSVSGLGTLLSGSYVGMAIGKASERARTFTAREVPPVVTGDTPGRFFRLKADTLGSLDYGTPIYFRRFQVGQVSSYTLAADGREVDVQIFVTAPYDQLVKTETRFWQASGLDFSLTASGLNVQTESLVSLLIGGVAFDTPVANETAPPAPADTRFDLFADQASAMKAPERGATQYALYFDESIRGVSAGAPVTFLGLPVGEVVSVRLQAGMRRSLRARVLVAVYPQRFLDVLTNPEDLDHGQEITPAVRRQVVDQLVARGLRAQLRTGNLLTGQLYIALEYVANASRARIDWSSTPPTFPAVKGDLTDLEAKLTAILAKIERLPIDAIGSDLKQSLASLVTTLNEAEALVRRWGSELTPELNAALRDARKTFTAAERTLATAETTVAADSALIEDLRGTLLEVRRAAQSIRVLTDYLERHPEALVQGKSEEAP